MIIPVSQVEHRRTSPLSIREVYHSISVISCTTQGIYLIDEAKIPSSLRSLKQYLANVEWHGKHSRGRRLRILYRKATGDWENKRTNSCWSFCSSHFLPAVRSVKTVTVPRGYQDPPYVRRSNMPVQDWTGPSRSFITRTRIRGTKIAPAPGPPYSFPFIFPPSISCLMLPTPFIPKRIFTNEASQQPALLCRRIMRVEPMGPKVTPTWQTRHCGRVPLCQIGQVSRIPRNWF